MEEDTIYLVLFFWIVFKDSSGTEKPLSSLTAKSKENKRDALIFLSFLLLLLMIAIHSAIYTAMKSFPSKS